MNRQSARTGARQAQLAALLATASLLTLSAGAWGADQVAPVEEVLITGSLIRGAPAVGVPVTAIGAADFAESGAVTTSELMRNIPSIEVQTTTASVHGGGRVDYSQNVAIHGFASPTGDVRTLLLVNNNRFPPQGPNGQTIDPSIIPAIAIQRIDVLASGASATYGADAVSGVINIILRRGFDGAISRLQLSQSTDIGGKGYVFSQLYGRSWDGGNITLSFENYEKARIQAQARDYYTANYERFGLMDTTPLGASNPGVISRGNPTLAPGAPVGFDARVGTRFCSNCFAMPHGIGWNFGDQTPGPTTNWSAIQAGAFVVGQANIQNQRINYMDSWMLPQQWRSAATATFDQELTNDFFGLGPVAFYGEAFYNNRRAIMHYHADSSGDAREHLSANQPNGMLVPTTNPYYPTGAPAGLRVHYNFAPEFESTRIAGGNVAGRYAFGFNFDELPFNWRGKLYYSMTDDASYAKSTNGLNANHVLAALGNTIASAAAAGTIPGQAAYVKPANVPFLNVFCDATVYTQCNSKTTMDYIRAFRSRTEHWKLRETGINLDGPTFDLPAGPLQIAFAGQTVSDHFYLTNHQDIGQHSKAVLLAQVESASRQAWSFTSQANIPIFGGDFSFPGFESLELELGYRFDKYDFLSQYVKTPKISANWGLGYGLVMRATWGKSFRTPSFGQLSATSGSRVLGVNILGGESVNGELLDCASFPGNPAGGALPGSLTAQLNPTCSAAAALRAPAGISATGGAGVALPIRGIALRPNSTKELRPEAGTQWVVGLNFTPAEGILKGLALDVSMFKIKINDSISTDESGFGPNDPNSRNRYIAIPNPNLPITDPANAEFLALIDGLRATGNATFNPSILPDVKFLVDDANTNIGFVTLQGIDFDTRYDWDMGNWGAWNVGVSGYYEVDQTTNAGPGSPVESEYDGKNSGNRLQRVRARLGWTDGIWNATLFANYRGHGGVVDALRVPDCYWADGFAPGSCYAGSGYYPQPTAIYGNMSPSHMEYDLSLGYSTGTRWASAYLHNLDFNLTVTNLLNKRPPFLIGSRTSRASERTSHDRRFSELQRFVSFTVTKTW
jgi:iron complex outermembrane receptor protein